MSQLAVLEVYFLPPLAISRLGGSDHPLDSFRWVADPAIHASGRTVIMPDATIYVAANGTPHVEVPDEIRFADDGKLRPVAPFFELWIRYLVEGCIHEAPLTLDLLEQLGIGTADLRFRISVANKKAQRRTQLTSCGFIARAEVSGDSHHRTALLASSPNDPEHPPLVLRDRPVPLGTFQVVRPIKVIWHDHDGNSVDLSVIRVRFTPARGEVYGPPDAIAAMPSPLPEGEELPWSWVAQGRMHDIVLPENRILNGDAAWSKYSPGRRGETDPLPYDSYDGAASGTQTSRGVVDDTCDGMIEASLVIGGTRFSAYARVTASPPDYAPDRRHFVSAADDLADRDLPRVPVTCDSEKKLSESEMADLLIRVFETASQINLDAERYKFLAAQGTRPPAPLTDTGSMTSDDKDYADLATDLIDARAARDDLAYPRSTLAFADLVHMAHAKLAERHYLLEFLRTRADHVRKLVRPAYGRIGTLANSSTSPPARGFRDPRNVRDRMHDMRMPPYMRDSDDTPLSLTWRQYNQLMDFLDALP